jgi:hypothetical protein
MGDHVEVWHGPRASLAELILHRWVLGYRLRGRGVAPENELTNRTFLHDGTRTNVWHGHCNRLLYLARWKVMAYRHAYPVLAMLWGAGYHLVAYLLVAASIAYLAQSAYDGMRRKWHNRDYAEPLAEACAQLVGFGEDVPPAEWIDLPLDFAKNKQGAVITMNLLRSFPTADEKKVTTLLTTVAQVLGVAKEDLDARQHFAGRKPQLIIKIKPPPPDWVKWVDVQAILPTLNPAEILLGLGRGGKKVTADLDHDSPHLLITSGSGGGKTTMVRNAIVQMVMRGAIGFIFDPKVTSHRWARGLDNVALLIKPATMFHALLAIQAEVHRRNDVAFEADIEDDQPDTGKRIIVGLEEMNTLRNMLTRYWNSIRKLPEWEHWTTNPALDALSDIVQMGRFVRVHVVMVGQRASVDSLGGGTRGGDIRESFFFRVLLQATAQTWRMLVPGLKQADIPGASRRRGRGHLAFGTEHHPFQGVDLREVEAQQAAKSGIVTKWDSVVALDNLAHGSGSDPGVSAGHWVNGSSGSLGHLGPTPDGFGATSVHGLPKWSENVAAEISAGKFDVPEVEPLVTLKEASSDQGRGIVPNTLESLYNHRKRTKGFPANEGERGKALLYAPAALRFFVAGLERSGGDDDGPDTHRPFVGGVGSVFEPAGDGVVPDGKRPVGHTVP